MTENRRVRAFVVTKLVWIQAVTLSAGQLAASLERTRVSDTILVEQESA